MANSQSSNGVVFRPSTITPAERGGGARTYPMVSKRCGSTAMMNGITEFEGGAAIPLHFHNCEEAVMLLEGQAIAEIDGEEQPSVPRDELDSGGHPASLPQRLRHSENAHLLDLRLGGRHAHPGHDRRHAPGRRPTRSSRLAFRRLRSRRFGRSFPWA